jgi:hypothetical protein
MELQGRCVHVRLTALLFLADFGNGILFLNTLSFDVSVVCIILLLFFVGFFG